MYGTKGWKEQEETEAVFVAKTSVPQHYSLPDILYVYIYIYVCIFSVHTKMLTINPENSKASPKKRQEIKSAV